MTDYLHLRITGELGSMLACGTSITGARSTAVPGYLLAPPALDGIPDDECPKCLEVARRLHRGEVLDGDPHDSAVPMRWDIAQLVGALNYARESAAYFLDCNQPDEVRRYLTEIERIGRSILALSKRI